MDVPMGVLVLPAVTPPTPEQLLAEPLANQFKPWTPGMQLPTSKTQDVWLRLQLPEQKRPESWLLRFPRLSLEKATLYQRLPDNPAQWQQLVAGIHVPNSSWPVRSRDPIFEVTTRSDQVQVYFIRLQHSIPITENVQLIYSSEFGNGANYAGALNGLIIGIFALLTLISLISWRINDNSHFGWFALFCVTVMLAQLTVSGYMIMRIWSDSVYLAKTMGWVMPLLSLAALARFALGVSYARDLSKPIFYGLWALIAVCALISLGILILPDDFPRGFLNAAYAAGMLIVLGSLSWIAWRSQHWLWMIVASMVPVVLSVLARLAYNQGWVAHMEIALLAGVITAALGLICIYGVLVANQRQRAGVTQREDALETTDGATGLFNERIAHARLPQIIMRSKRFEKSCGAILVRWIDCERVLPTINAIERGRIFSHLGSRLNRLARDIDTVARFGDDQFIFLVEAPITREQINALASKILSTCLRPSTSMPDQKGFDLHLALWLSNEVPAQASQVFELLKTRINQMREGTQRRVQFIDTPLTTAPQSESQNPDQAQRLIEKINALEATQGLPTINLKRKDTPV
jgi:two-component system, sensor histidine kinase LadS